MWSVIRNERGFRLDAIGSGDAHAVEATVLLVATGAIERVLPFPGWTTPGVFGLAAATTMLKSQRISPGKRVAVAGAGPLLAAVAAGVVKAGAEVAAVVDVNGPASSPPRPLLRCASDSPRRVRAGCCGCCGPACHSIFVQRRYVRSETGGWRRWRSNPWTAEPGAGRTRRR